VSEKQPDRSFDEHLEQSLVSECLRRYERFAARGLVPADFYILRHREVVAASQALWSAGEPVTVDAVALALQRAGKVPPEGALRHVAGMAVPTTVLPDGSRLKELRRLRSVGEAVTIALGRVKEGDLQGALSALSGVDQLGDVRDSQMTGFEAVQRLLESKGSQAQAAERYVELPEGHMRRALGRVGVGSLIVIAADSNVGKSLVTLSLVIGYARNAIAGFISMEDPQDLTSARYLAAFTEGVTAREIHRDEYSSTEAARDAYVKIGYAVEAIRYQDRVIFDELVGETELEVMASMSRMAAKGARLVVVDYLQEVGCSQPAQDRRNEIRMIAKRLKSHAIRLGVVLVLVSQIARPKDGNPNTKPTKHSLKESGDVTNMAEVIVVLWREREDDFAPIKASVAKSKWGGLGAEWELRRDPTTGILHEV
jgi:replicative DNA helicase